MATQVPALIQPVDPRPAGLLLSDPRVAAQLVNYYQFDTWSHEQYILKCLQSFLLNEYASIM